VGNAILCGSGENQARRKRRHSRTCTALEGRCNHALTGHVPFEAPTVEELVSAHVHTPLTPPNLVLPETRNHQRCPDEGDGERTAGPVHELR